MGVNDDRRQNSDSDLIEIKRSLFQSRLFDETSANILVKGRVTAVNAGMIMWNEIKKIYK